MISYNDKFWLYMLIFSCGDPSVVVPGCLSHQTDTAASSLLTSLVTSKQKVKPYITSHVNPYSPHWSLPSKRLNLTSLVTSNQKVKPYITSHVKPYSHHWSLPSKRLNLTSLVTLNLTHITGHFLAKG